jgi:HSP20 family molecular chaperone IbpA
MAGLTKKDDSGNLTRIQTERQALQAKYDDMKKKSEASGVGKNGYNKYNKDLKSLSKQLQAKDKEYAARQKGQNADGSFVRPEYESLINKDTGLLDSSYTLGDKWQNVEADQTGLNKFKGEALRDAGTASAWGNMMTQKADMEKQAELDRVAASQNAGIKSAYDDLAAQGGLSGGSRERIASSGLRDIMRGRQDVRRNAMADKMQISTTDEENRMKMLAQVPGMDMQQANLAMQNQQGSLAAKQFDTQQAVGQMDKERQSEMDAWMKNQEVWAANKQAQAQKSGASSCFPAGTLITMADESQKLIEHIEEGDKVLGGGKVEVLCVFTNRDGYDLFDYEGVLVTADHAVLEDNKWTRVKDSEKAELTKLTVKKVYNLINEKHMIVINGVIFSDYVETDEDHKDDRASLKALNGDV